MTEPAAIKTPARGAPLTVAAIAVVVYAVSTVIHEGLGHGGACVLVGGKPLELSSMHFDGKLDGLAPWTGWMVAAGGIVANLIAGFLCLGLYRSLRGAAAHLRYFLWLMAAVNLMQGLGYGLFSGVAGIGDWNGIIPGLAGNIPLRVLLAGVSLAIYMLIVRMMAGELGPFVGEGPGRVSIAARLMVIPYLTGAALELAAGFLNPHGAWLVAISGAAASLGGTSGLAWGAQWLNDPRLGRKGESAGSLSLNWTWVATAAIVAAVFIAVLGPGIKFG